MSISQLLSPELIDGNTVLWHICQCQALIPKQKIDILLINVFQFTCPMQAHDNSTTTSKENWVHFLLPIQTLKE